MRKDIEEGFMVFVVDGELGVGAVREVRNGGAEFLVNIQNGGDFVIPASAIRDVHSGKVMLDIQRLDEDVRRALAHPHDAEYRQYAAVDPSDGALKE